MADGVANWERTEEPSPRRLREARLDGRIARSPDLGTACLLLAAAAAVTLGGGAAVRSLGGFLAAALAPSRPFTDPAAVGDAALEGVLAGASIVLPAAAGLAGVAWLAGFLQIGAVFTTRTIAPRPVRLSPAANLAGLFSMRSPRRLGIDLAKVAAAVGAVWWAIGGEAGTIVGWMSLPAGEAAGGAAGMLVRVAFAAGAALLALGFLDWLFERRRIRGELRMTRREAMEDRKEEEGDPSWRGRRVEFGRSLADSPAVAVRRATALVFSRAESLAFAIEVPDSGEPRVVAAGGGSAAVRLAALAAAAGVPIVPDGSLARGFAASRCRPGDAVPASVRTALLERLAALPEVAARLGRDGRAA
jgi:flagellar biosynthetic protein FlhB